MKYGYFDDRNKEYVITNVKTPAGSGYQLGNPSYAETNDRYIVCDMIQTSSQSNFITAIDLFQQTMTTLHGNGYISTVSGSFPNLGFARYSPDDKIVIYERYNAFLGKSALYQLALHDDKMTPSGSEIIYHDGSIPVWFVRTPTYVAEDALSLPVPFSLGQNFPNPFNPSATISFTLYKPGKVTLKVFNSFGQIVATLVEGYKETGEYRVVFDGARYASGTYMYQLAGDAYTQTKQMTLVK